MHMCDKQLTQWGFFVANYREIRNTRCVRFVVASSSKLAGYDETYTAIVSYLAVTQNVHSECFLFGGNPKRTQRVFRIWR